MLITLGVAFALSECLLAFFFLRYAYLIDQRLKVGPFSHSINIYAAPVTVVVGDRGSPEEIVARLRQGGYGPSPGNPVGHYSLRANAVEIYPGPESYFAAEPAVIHFGAGRITHIVSLADNTERTELQLEPQLITNLSDQHREKRHLVRYAEIPPALVHAVVSTEDKKFFEHSGFDLPRMLKAAWVDLKEGRKEQGASTLTMQLARNLWLEPDKSWRRKLAELMMTVHLEHRLSKQQIFEDYANQVYMGRRGTFSINGFGEAARAYFGKDIGQLTLPEAALLAGMVQRPAYYNPFRYPDRAAERRNVVLTLMQQNGYLTAAEYAGASKAPIRLSTAAEADSVQLQYSLDLVNDEMSGRVQGTPSRVYTTLDLNLQRAAEEAVRAGIEYVDQQLRKRRRGEAIPPGQPQVALVALDPHTGEIKALVGGRNYRASQLDHALAERQPGSVFKPFVYAAALDTAISGGPRIFTPASTLLDEPTTFQFGSQTYTPTNFQNQYLGTVSLRSALAHSLNVATVRLAQMVGYDAVVRLARRAGMEDSVRPTPAVALGAYDETPLDMAGAYTVFANHGIYVRPTLISAVRDGKGDVLYAASPQTRRVLDPRVAYLMVNLLEGVVNYGTGSGVRARGLSIPVAGKTGTSHDGWFAGFSSQLLCVVWVGFDDNRDLGLEGARSALPVWTEFMKRALALRGYRDIQPFSAPDGVVSANVCNDSGQLATPACPSTHREVFIEGTQPAVECPLHGSNVLTQGDADRLTPIGPISPPNR